MEISKKDLVLKKTKDRWAFLEEIEAPMWVDLTLEANSSPQDVNDDWFQTSHLFHQWSSRQLKFAFSHPGQEAITSEVDLQEPSSPKLPPSVSRSRGKHYKSKKWREDYHDASFDQQHPARVISRRSFQVDFSSDQETKSKPKFLNSRGASGLKWGLVCEHRASGDALCISQKPKSSGGYLTSSLGSVENKSGESNARSTITTDNSHHHQQKFMEVSSQPVGHASGPLSGMRNGLRKSCATRKASRLKTDSVSRQSVGQQSSSGTSSVGSCSNPVYEVKRSTLTSRRLIEKTPESRNMTKWTLAEKNKMKPSNASKTSTLQNVGGKCSISRGNKISSAKPTPLEAVKPKVQYLALRERALVPLQVNRQNTSTAALKVKEKLGVGRHNYLAGAGKENSAAWSNSMHRKCSGTGNRVGSFVTVQKSTKQKVVVKTDRTGLASVRV
ncbi:Cyclic nucleotide-gated channel [Quillaja saponaria]|uniref:Cyclic nucleotide-gated channel n=1 Tax=Quillaja saponaria TaxID=32244 RepID=A0AAD7PBD6_QUISA|nr:Cyclic nucleotide-gated channel [Quillaja saponaria]